MIKDLKWEENDDITRVMFFHVNSFRGISSELEDVKEIINILGDISTEGVRIVPVTEYFVKKAGNYKQPREVAEKAIHRLLLIRVIKDYTIDYANKEFRVHLTGFSKEEIIQAYSEYVEGYLHSRRQVEYEKATKFYDLPIQEFIIKIVELLLHFIYDVIEKGRRRALYEILFVFSNSPDDNTIRQKILRYLEVTQFSEKMDEILQAENAGLGECKDFFENITSSNEAAELRRQVSRMLESYPDHPALLMLRSLTEIYCLKYKVEVVKENFIASISSAKSNYSIDLSLVFEFAAWAIEKINKRNNDLAVELIQILIEPNVREELRILVEHISVDYASLPAWKLLNNLNESCKTLIT